ncbi:hypothetical protein BC332_12811 [Capsicum chinense]|nr:hypothetical protein BC332_12811 [Capsicum chinense]
MPPRGSCPETSRESHRVPKCARNARNCAKNGMNLMGSDALTYTDATAQGLQPDQIILTDTESKQEHIRYSSLADLFPDTPLYYAHTTGTDVLWAGLPMITLPLEKMATRVAGSLCLATGLGVEMIVSRYDQQQHTLDNPTSGLWGRGQVFYD